jgi:hypothetical protein
VGCAVAERGRGPHGPPPSAADEARRQIAARIDHTVEATKRLDVDALARGGGARRRADGSEMSLAEARDAVAGQLAGVERTISLVVRLDSLRLVSDSAALVYTMQRWERMLVASDGTRHRALTQNWLEQRWALGADGWRGSGEVRETQPGTSTLDGVPFVVVEGARPD